MVCRKKVSRRHVHHRHSAFAGAVPLMSKCHGDEHGQGMLFPLTERRRSGRLRKAERWRGKQKPLLLLVGSEK
jgi:hypothetical protein